MNTLNLNATSASTIRPFLKDSINENKVYCVLYFSCHFRCGITSVTELSSISLHLLPF